MHEHCTGRPTLQWSRYLLCIPAFVLLCFLLPHSLNRQLQWASAHILYCMYSYQGTKELHVNEPNEQSPTPTSLSLLSQKHSVVLTSPFYLKYLTLCCFVITLTPFLYCYLWLLLGSITYCFFMLFQTLKYCHFSGSFLAFFCTHSVMWSIPTVLNTSFILLIPKFKPQVKFSLVLYIQFSTWFLYLWCSKHHKLNRLKTIWGDPPIKIFPNLF